MMLHYFVVGGSFTYKAYYLVVFSYFLCCILKPRRHSSSEVFHVTPSDAGESAGAVLSGKHVLHVETSII